MLQSSIGDMQLNTSLESEDLYHRNPLNGRQVKKSCMVRQVTFLFFVFLGFPRFGITTAKNLCQDQK